jgi:isopentenyl-diphosphate delta-isomerase
MLQQRAKSKYHCGGMWTNTTCSHPRPGEDIFEAAHRRLQEEMGFDTDLKKVTEFVYKVPFDNGLTEHEYLHVFIGRYNNAPKLNPEEADDWKWISLNELEQGIETNQEIYTFWMQKALPAVKEALKEL